MSNGIGITLPLQLGSTGYFEQSFDVLSQIKSNFINLVLTRKGERVHQPEFGCCIHDYLFEQLTSDTIEGARLCVESAINRWMPFLELLRFEINATVTDIDSNKLRLYVGYRLTNAPNIQDQIVLEF
jgi:uncharacterized protein